MTYSVGRPPVAPGAYETEVVYSEAWLVADELLREDAEPASGLGVPNTRWRRRRRRRRSLCWAIGHRQEMLEASDHDQKTSCNPRATAAAR
jgi:hypothetical protein